LVATALGIYQVVVRTIDIDALLAGLIRILKHVRLAIGYVFPQRHIWIAGR